MYGTVLAVLLGLLAAGTAYLGVHLTLHPPTTPGNKRAYKLAFIVCGLISVVLIGLQARQNEREFKQLPRDVAEYIKNTMPPGTLFTRTVVLGAPTGLLAIVDGDEKQTALLYGQQLQEFLRKQGEPPKRASGEPDLDFLIRSNAWYSRVMNEYNKAFGDRSVSLVKALIKQKLLEPQVVDLAKNPVNPLGLKALAIQLEVAGSKLASQETR